MALYSAQDFTRLLGTPGFSDALLTQHFELYRGYVKTRTPFTTSSRRPRPASRPLPTGPSSSAASAGSGTECGSTRRTLEI